MNHAETSRYYDKLRALRLVAFSWSVRIDNYPKLWTSIYVFDPQPVWSMALQKSQTAGIDVDCNTRRNWWAPEVTHNPQPFLDGLRPHVTRVRSLVIKEKDLESLIVGISTSSQLGAFPTSKTDKAADPTRLASILAQGTPMLQTIHLYRCSLTWPSLGLTNLESIKLHRGLGHLYRSQFLSILAASPALELFCFIGTVLPDPSGVQAQPSSVRLDVLKTLQLSLEDSPEPFDLLNSIAATPAKSFTFNFSAEKGGVLGPNIGDIWTFAKGIAETETRLFLGANEEGSWFAIGRGKGQFSVSAEGTVDTEEEDRTCRMALFEAVLKQIPNTWLSSVGEAELEIASDWILRDLLLALNDYCPNIAHFSLPYWNNTWESLLGRPEVGSAWKFPRLSSIHFFDSYDGGLLETAKDRKQAADAGEIITGLKKLVAIVDTDGYIEIVEPEEEELEELGLVDRQYINVSSLNKIKTSGY